MMGMRLVGSFYDSLVYSALSIIRIHFVKRSVTVTYQQGLVLALNCV